MYVHLSFQREQGDFRFLGFPEQSKREGKDWVEERSGSRSGV